MVTHLIKARETTVSEMISLIKQEAVLVLKVTLSTDGHPTF